MSKKKKPSKPFFTLTPVGNINAEIVRHIVRKVQSKPRKKPSRLPSMKNNRDEKKNKIDTLTAGQRKILEDLQASKKRDQEMKREK